MGHGPFRNALLKTFVLAASSTWSVCKPYFEKLSKQLNGEVQLKFDLKFLHHPRPTLLPTCKPCKVASWKFLCYINMPKESSNCISQRFLYENAYWFYCLFVLMFGPQTMSRSFLTLHSVALMVLRETIWNARIEPDAGHWFWMQCSLMQDVVIYMQDVALAKKKVFKSVSKQQK